MVEELLPVNLDDCLKLHAMKNGAFGPGKSYPAEGGHSKPLRFAVTRCECDEHHIGHAKFHLT
jgi:hypothetical protein